MEDFHTVYQVHWNLEVVKYLATNAHLCSLQSIASSEQQGSCKAKQ